MKYSVVMGFKLINVDFYDNGQNLEKTASKKIMRG